MIVEIIPVIHAIKANKILKEKNKTQDIKIPDEIEEIDIKCIEEDYKNAIDTKNRFEDKAKTIIAALTIAITLIINLSKMLEIVSEKFANPVVNILIFILAILAILYMLMAGIMSIQVLIKENLVYPIPLLERTRQDKKSIFINTQLNVNQNLIRNNIIFSAYCSIRNSVFCLVIIFILTILPFCELNSESVEYEGTEIHVNVSFGIDAIVWLTENKDKNINIDKMIGMFIGNDEERKNIYDKENQIIVIIKKVDDLYVVENIIGDIEYLEKTF